MKKASSSWAQTTVPQACGEPNKAEVLRSRLLEFGFRQVDFVRRTGLDYRSWVENWEIRDSLILFREQVAKDALSLLYQFFILNKVIVSSELESLLGQEWLEIGIETGWLKAFETDEIQEEPTLFCPFSLFEIEGMLILTDSLLQAQTGCFFPDSVMPLYPESYELAQMTNRSPVRRMLDIGTGSGVHALLASRHSDVVTAIDINSRALAFTHFNAWLNARNNVKVFQLDMAEVNRLGDFDLVVSNPPYMPDLEGPLLAAGGADGEFFIRLILGRLDTLLSETGICLLVHLLYDQPGNEGVRRMQGYLPVNIPSKTDKNASNQDEDTQELSSCFPSREFKLAIAHRKAFATGLDPKNFLNIRYAFTLAYRSTLLQHPRILKKLQQHNRSLAAQLELSWINL